MSCISTSSISILVNGKPAHFLQPTRSIRHGDPLSPYIFIIYMESLPRLIDHAVDLLKWMPVKISRKSIPLSHLLFTDDLVLFSRATEKNVHTIINIFNHFRSQFGQYINFSKSKILLSVDVPNDTQNKISSLFNIAPTINFGRYLACL